MKSRNFIPIFNFHSKSLISRSNTFLLSAEGELLVDQPGPGVFRDGKVWCPEPIKIYNIATAKTQ